MTPRFRINDAVSFYSSFSKTYLECVVNKIFVNTVISEIDGREIQQTEIAYKIARKIDNNVRYYKATEQELTEKLKSGTK